MMHLCLHITYYIHLMQLHVALFKMVHINLMVCLLISVTHESYTYLAYTNELKTSCNSINYR